MFSWQPSRRKSCGLLRYLRVCGVTPDVIEVLVKDGTSVLGRSHKESAREVLCTKGRHANVYSKTYLR